METYARIQKGNATHTEGVVVEATDDQLDSLFHALADPTRRDILRRGFPGDSSVSRIAAAYPMSFAAVQKHVAVLERSGLISKQRHGRELLVQTDVEAFDKARQALDDLELSWRGRVDRMSDLLSRSPDPVLPRHQEVVEP